MGLHSRCEIGSGPWLTTKRRRRKKTASLSFAWTRTSAINSFSFAMNWTPAPPGNCASSSRASSPATHLKRAHDLKRRASLIKETRHGVEKSQRPEKRNQNPQKKKKPPKKKKKKKKKS